MAVNLCRKYKITPGMPEHLKLFNKKMQMSIFTYFRKGKLYRFTAHSEIFPAFISCKIAAYS